MKSLKILLFSFLICCATTREENFKVVLDLNLQNLKKHLEVQGRKAKLDIVFVKKEGELKTFSVNKKLSVNDARVLQEKLENLPWEQIKERYVSRDGMLQRMPPIMISLFYKEKRKDIIIIGDLPEELIFIFNVLEPYLQIDSLMLR